jgi:hypothetical protein
MTKLVTDTDLAAFCAKLNAMVTAFYAANYTKVAAPVISAMTGPKYARLVAKNPGDQYGSAYGFVDLATGDLLKTSSWKAPAKGARGNIYADNPLAGCTPYGMAYLK